MALAGGAVKNCSTNAAIWLANVCIPSTLNCVQTDANGLWVRNDGYTGQVYSVSAGGYNSTTVTMTNTAYYPELGVYGLWEVVCLTPAPTPPSSCLTGDTLVLIADGSERRVDEVEPGDLVLGRDGSVGRVVHIEQPPLGARMLYAFNGGRPFITSEHPVMTASGWKSVDPDATEAENPELRVASLQAGDRLVKVTAVVQSAAAGEFLASPIPEVIVEAVRLFAISAHQAHPDTKLYNLVLDEGHTYFANGYLVHNKNGTY